MGAPVEGMTYEEIDRKYGYVDGYLPYQHYGNGWDREPGTTEDGVERLWMYRKNDIKEVK